MKKLIKLLEQKEFSREAKNLEKDNTVLKIRYRIVDIDTIKFILNILTFDSEISSTLTRLILKSAFIRSDGLKLIAEFLQQNSKLISLDLSSNGYLQPRAIEPIGKALEFNDTLKYLSLNDDKVGVIGVKAIAEGLKVNKSLTYLDLGSDCNWNNEWAIGDKGAEFLAEALKTNNTLTYLSLERSSISLEGINFFIETLQTNYSLTTLILNRWLGGYKEEPKEVEEIICLNRELVKKLSLFLINDFSLEDKNINLNIQNLTALKFYQIADKQLLIDHLREYEDVTDVFFLLSTASNFVKENPLALAGVCKVIKPDTELTKGEVHISHLSTEIILHILSFLKPYSIETGYYDEPLEIDKAIESLEIVEVTGNNYCSLS